MQEKNAQQEYRFRVTRAKIEKQRRQELAIRNVLRQASDVYRQALVADEEQQVTLCSQTLMHIRKAEGMIDESISYSLRREFQLLKENIEQFSEAASEARAQRTRDQQFCQVIEVSVMDSFFQNAGMWYGEQPDFLKRLEVAFQNYGIQMFDDVQPMAAKINESRIKNELLRGLHHWESQFFWVEMDRRKTLPQRSWLCNLLDEVDPDPYRIKLRKFLLQRATFDIVAEMENPTALESLPTIQLIMDGTDRARYTEKPKLLKEGYWKKRCVFLNAAYLKYPSEFSINYVLARHCMGYSLNRRELDLNKAVEHLLVCYAMKPECPGVLARLMNVFTKLEDSEQAKIFGDKLVDLYPEMAESHFVYAVYSSMLGNNDEAIAAARRSIELDTTFVDAHTLICRIFLEQKEFELASRCMKEARKIMPESKFIQHWSDKVAQQIRQANQNQDPAITR